MTQHSTILLVGHGTRDARGTAEFLHLATAVAARLDPIPVAPCFLELVEPTIHDAVYRTVERGTERLVVLPVLLFAAGHAKQDIPAAVEAALRKAAGEHGRVATWRQTDVLECHPKVLELSARRYAEAAAGDPLGQKGDICLVMVGRGSHDPEATAAMRRFAALRAEMSGVERCETAFIAMAEPRYPAVLRAAGERGHRTIVVQPHLLFEGELLGQMRRDLAAISAEFPSTDWRLTAHLGPDPLLVDAVESLCRDAAEN